MREVRLRLPRGMATRRAARRLQVRGSAETPATSAARKTGGGIGLGSRPISAQAEASRAPPSPRDLKVTGRTGKNRQNCRSYFHVDMVIQA